MQQQKDQMVGQQAEQMKMMQWMMYIMPLMFFFIFNDYRLWSELLLLRVVVHVGSHHVDAAQDDG